MIWVLLHSLSLYAMKDVEVWRWCCAEGIVAAVHDDVEIPDR